MGESIRTYTLVSKSKRADRDRRYNNSPKGQARRRRYEERHPNRWGRSAEYWRQRYRRIQEEAGCHIKLREFYPGYRLIKALAEMRGQNE